MLGLKDAATVATATAAAAPSGASAAAATAEAALTNGDWARCGPHLRTTCYVPLPLALAGGGDAHGAAIVVTMPDGATRRRLRLRDPFRTYSGEFVARGLGMPRAGAAASSSPTSRGGGGGGGSGGARGDLYVVCRTTLPERLTGDERAALAALLLGKRGPGAAAAAGTGTDDDDGAAAAEPEYDLAPPTVAWSALSGDAAAMRAQRKARAATPPPDDDADGEGADDDGVCCLGFAPPKNDKRGRAAGGQRKHVLPLVPQPQRPAVPRLCVPVGRAVRHWQQPARLHVARRALLPATTTLPSVRTGPP